MALFHFRKRRSAPTGPVDAIETDVVDVTVHDLVQVNISIHDTPHYDDRIGEALCLVAAGRERENDRPHAVESSGAVVPITRHPNRVTRAEFAQLIEQAGRGGHLLDGFLEVEATVDLVDGTITWQPEDGIGVQFDYLDEVVENTFASLVETNLFGEWFVPTSVERRTVIVS